MSDWTERAACAAAVATATTPAEIRRLADMWYPETLDESQWHREQARKMAKAVCAGCPVAGECLADRDRYGIRAGQDPADESRELKRKRRRDQGARPNPNRPVAECGTDAGYFRHIRRLHEPACDDCKAAHAAAERERGKASTLQEVA